MAAAFTIHIVISAADSTGLLTWTLSGQVSTNTFSNLNSMNFLKDLLQEFVKDQKHLLLLVILSLSFYKKWNCKEKIDVSQDLHFSKNRQQKAILVPSKGKFDLQMATSPWYNYCKGHHPDEKQYSQFNSVYEAILINSSLILKM